MKPIIYQNIQITEEYLSKVFNDRYRRDDYHDAVDESNRMDMLRNRERAFQLIEKRNHGEVSEIWEYRKANLRMITLAPLDMVFNVLSIIGNSKDLIIDFPLHPAILNDFPPQDYFDKLPIFGSLRNWLFGNVLPDMIFEPNGGILTFYEPTTNETEYVQPYFLHYKAESVIDYVAGQLVVLKYETDESEFCAFLVVDKYFYREYQKNAKGDYILTYELPHNVGTLPFVLFGGIQSEFSDESIYRSFLSGAAEMWTEALASFSDEQAISKRFAHPIQQELSDDDCLGCSDKERAEHNAKKKQISTSIFAGSNVSTSSPFSVRTQSPTDKQGNPVPVQFPFVAFSSPDAGLIGKAKERIDKLIFEGFQALNMGFLAESPANQSGIAKEYDRDGLNSFLYKIATHLVNNVLKPCIYFASKLRYGVRLNDNRDALLALMPVITVPTRFDTLTAQILEEQISRSKQSGIYDGTLNEMQIEFIKKRYEDKPELVIRLSLELKHQPYSGKTAQEVIDMNLAGMVSEIDGIMYSNISHFVMRAMEENINFALLTYTQQHDILLKYAEEYKAKNAPVLVPTAPQDLQFNSRTDVNGNE